MKNLSSWRSVAYVLAIIIISISGMFLVQQLASADGNSEEMEAVYRNYDWGLSKPGGQWSEDLHRAHLDNNFQVWISHQGSQIAFNVNVPGELKVPKHGKTETVDYSIESVFHKYIPIREDCDNERTGDVLELEGYGGRKGMVSMYADLAADNEDQYSCLVVKLKGVIVGDPDTHPE